MRFIVEIPDELFRSTNSNSQPSTTVSAPNSTSDAMSGGAGPAVAGGGVVDVGHTSDGLSAGSAEQDVTPGAPGAGTQAGIDGGAAPPVPARN
jgi:hypothetical protein